MQLVAFNRCREAADEHEQALRLREIGGRLQHVTACYGRLVKDVTDTAVSETSVDRDIEALNRHLEAVIVQVQEALVERTANRRAEHRAALARTMAMAPPGAKRRPAPPASRRAPHFPPAQTIYQRPSSGQR
jgi:hypothetical protein